MKKLIYKTALVALFAGFLCSCSGAKTITVQGFPGTEIFQGDTKLNVIPQSGICKVSADDDTAILYSKAPGQNYIVPFVVKDVSKQTTNQDIRVTMPSIAYAPSGQTEQSSSSAVAVAATSTQATTSVTATTPPAATAPAQTAVVSRQRVRQESQSISRDGNTPAAAIEGTYTGTGYLNVSEAEVESLRNIKIVIRRTETPDVVSVNVIEANSNDFFGSASKYTVQSAGGTFRLTNTLLPRAIITISAGSEVMYHHPALNVDGKPGSLSIIANRQ